MPFKDPEKRRAYHREYSRLRRVCQTPAKTPVPSQYKLQTVQDIINLLAGQIEAVKADPEAKTLEKARCIGYLAGIALKAVEAANLEARIEALERVLNERKVAAV